MKNQNCLNVSESIKRKSSRLKIKSIARILSKTKRKKSKKNRINQKQNAIRHRFALSRWIQLSVCATVYYSVRDRCISHVVQPNVPHFLPGFLLRLWWHQVAFYQNACRIMPAVRHSSHALPVHVIFGFRDAPSTYRAVFSHRSVCVSDHVALRLPWLLV